MPTRLHSWGSFLMDASGPEPQKLGVASSLQCVAHHVCVPARALTAADTLVLARCLILLGAVNMLICLLLKH